MENTKRDLSLDFTKPRHPRGGQPVPSLVTPSITPLLGLTTPELNKMVMANCDELAVLTPNGISSIIPQASVLPSPLIPTTVNNNSNNIINNNNNNNNTPTSNNNNNISGISTNININNNTNHSNNNSNNNHHHNHNGNGQNIKRSDKSYRDLDSEKIEKKRERNRLAAKKCRQRKLETIDELRKAVSEYQAIDERKQSDLDRTQRDLDRVQRELERIQTDYERKLVELERVQTEFEKFKNLRNKESEQLHMQINQLKNLVRQ